MLTFNNRQAVIKESMRLHPGVSYPLEREVPDGGAQLCGVFIPGSTVVGVHAWVLHRDKDIFGEDAEGFRPERWIDADAEQLKKMDRGFFSVSNLFTTGMDISCLCMVLMESKLMSILDTSLALDREHAWVGLTPFISANDQC